MRIKLDKKLKENIVGIKRLGGRIIGSQLVLRKEILNIVVHTSSRLEHHI